MVVGAVVYRLREPVRKSVQKQSTVPQKAVNRWPKSFPCPTLTTVSFHNFKSQNFKLSVSNPKSRYVAYLSVLSQISNCQGLGRKNKHEFLKTDRTQNTTTTCVPSFFCPWARKLQKLLSVGPCCYIFKNNCSKSNDNP